MTEPPGPQHALEEAQRALAQARRHLVTVADTADEISRTLALREREIRTARTLNQDEPTPRQQATAAVMHTLARHGTAVQAARVDVLTGYLDLVEAHLHAAEQAAGTVQPALLTTSQRRDLARVTDQVTTGTTLVTALRPEVAEVREQLQDAGPALDAARPGRPAVRTAAPDLTLAGAQASRTDVRAHPLEGTRPAGQHLHPAAVALRTTTQAQDAAAELRLAMRHRPTTAEHAATGPEAAEKPVVRP